MRRLAVLVVLLGLTACDGSAVDRALTDNRTPAQQRADRERLDREVQADRARERSTWQAIQQNQKRKDAWLRSH